MKTKPSQTNRNFSVLGSLLLLAGLSSLKAASGTWTSDSSGNWRDTTKWLGGTVADGTGNTADFSTINLTADRTVTLDAPHTLSTLKFGDVVPDYNWILSGANILTLGTTPVINVVNQTATISSVIAGTAFTRIGAGALTLNGLAVNTFTGTLALNSGTTTEDFSNLATPTDLVKNTVVLAMGGGTLSVNGAASVTSAQTFASTTLSAGGGGAIVLASGASGTANLTLGAITRNAGTALILTLPATGNIKTSSGTAAQVLTGGTTALPYAFITDAAGNLLDYAGVSGTTPFNIGLGSTVAAAQYVTTTGAGLYSINAGGGIVDVTTAGGCTGIAWSSSTPSWNGVRFNAPPTTGPWLIQPSNKNINLGALLITTNVGPNNVTTGTTGAIDNNGTRDFVLAQDNPYGELQWNGNGEFRGGSDLVKIGRGTIVCGSGLSQGFTGNPGVYVNGGVFAVNVNANFGAGGTGAAIDLNGGTAMGMVTLTLDNAGLNKRNINLLGNGGGLAAAAGTVLTVDGVVGGAAGTGPLVIGIPASSANGNIAGLLPGTGSIANGQTFNTANTTAVNATGTVALTGANTYTGGTILYTGTAQINGINNFGGANFGGLTFNGGTLQYASGATGFGSLDMSSATAAKSITLASGGGTMDMNGNPISYANAIGNSGTGTLLVTDTAGGGSLTLNGAGTYTGATTVGDGTHTVALNVNSTLASSGVTVNSSATLGGSGTISGNVIWVNGSSAKLTQGSPMTVSGTVAFNDTGSGNTITVLASGLTTGNYTLLTASSVTGTINPVPAGTGIVAAGYVGTLSIVGGNSVVLAVVAAGTTSSWTDANHGADDNWSDAVNWNNGVPHLAQDTAIFGSGGVGNPVNLDVAETVGGISFTNAAGSYTISGANTLTLDNSGSGAAINVTAGTANAINTAVALSDNLTVTANSGKTVTLGGIVANTGASKTLTVNGGGTVVLSQANTYGPSAGTLGTTLGGTTVQVGTSTSLGSGDVSVTSSSTIKAGAASLTIANNIGVSSLQTATVDNSIASGNNLTLTTGVISGSGGVTKTSDGTLTLGGANTYSGGTIISAGVLSISADGASGGSAGNLGVVPASATANNISLNGGDLLASTTLALHANRGINAVATGLLDAAGSQTLTVSGIIAGNNLTINSVAPTPGTVVLGAANTLNGTTLISAGTLTLGNTLALQNSTLNYSAGTVGLGSLTTLTLGGLSGTQNFGLTNASGAAVALTVDGNGGTTGFTGILNGTGSLDKTGTGGLTIGSGGSGGAAYTGVTAVDNGTLTLGGSTTMSSTGVIQLTGNAQSGTCVLNVVDNAIIGTTLGIYLASEPTGGSGGGNGNPGICTLAVKNSASLSAASLTFGGVGVSTRVSSSSVTVQDSAALTLTGTIDLENVAGSTAQTTALNLNGGILTAGNIIATSGGGAHLSQIHFNGGVLKANADSAIFLPALGGMTAAVDSGGALINDNGYAITIAAALVHGTGTPDGGLTKLGNGTLTLTGASSYTGITTNSAGTLNINGINALGGAVYGGFTFNGGTLQYAPAFIGNGSGDISKNSAGSPVAKPVTFTANATLDLNGNTVTYANPVGNGGVGGLNVNSTTSGGVLNLSVANSYGGNTTVGNNATLNVNNPSGSGTGSGMVAVSSGGQLGGGGSISGAVTVSSGGTLAPGSGATGALTLGASPTLNGTLAFAINKTDATLTQGQLALGANNLTYGGALTVTATGDPLTNGDSFILIVTNGMVGGVSGWVSSVTLPVLGSGITWDTNNLATTGVLEVYSFVTTPLALTTPVNTPATIAALKLANHAVSALGPVYITAVSMPANGGTAVTNMDGSLTYTPPSPTYTGNDSFDLTFQDGHGLPQTVAVSVTVGSGNAQGANTLTITGPDGNDNYTVTFAGIPDYNYTVETNGTAMGSGWAKEFNPNSEDGNYMPDAVGRFSITNSMTEPSLFLRTVYPAY